jgi:hypothetical protein
MIQIKKVSNGFIVKSTSEEYVFPEISNCELSALKDLLNTLICELSCEGSRYDAKRIYVVIAPGDKHSDFTDAHGDVLFPEEG